jgi:hypothetical protein
LQGQLGPHVPDDFAKTQLLAMSVGRPELELAWRYRNLSDDDRRAADLEFRQLEALYYRTRQAPDDPRKAQALAAMERRGQELGLAMNARTIIANARRDVLRAASRARPPIDEEATAMRDEVIAAVRGASTPVIPEAPVKWGSLTGKEFREKVLRDHGFDPGGW